MERVPACGSRLIWLLTDETEEVLREQVLVVHPNCHCWQLLTACCQLPTVLLCLISEVFFVALKPSNRKMHSRVFDNFH